MDALDRIRTTMDLLLEYGYIEWQGSLKDTYFSFMVWVISSNGRAIALHAIGSGIDARIIHFVFIEFFIFIHNLKW